VSILLSTGERSSSAKPIVLADRWRRYQRDGDRVDRDALVLTYSPLVKHVAGRVASRLPAHVELADLISVGLGGLIDAVERFEPDRGVGFEAFATPRIRGAIFDELRAMDWVPRRVREEGRRIERATAALTTRLQRLPDHAELADELSLDAPGLDDALQRVASSQMLALDQPHQLDRAPADSFTLLDTFVDEAAEDPATASTDAELRDRVARAVLQLTGRAQTILALRYHQQLTHTEIGLVLQITESRVSQIHTQSMIELRALLS
jgi:RNA polymerase sigma factor for flagellar operon FliA